MSDPVEAQSLSTLTNLFANPPQYPRNPTHKVHEPLVLYIVRVPGSKDVFLSPVKPPTKVSIGIEAIESSLYYFHVPTDEDEEVKQSIDTQQQSDEETRPSVSIARKPLPSSPLAAHPLPSLPDESSETARDRTPGRLDSRYRFGEAGSLRINTNTSEQAYRKPLVSSSPSKRSNLYQASGDYEVPSPIYAGRPNEFVNTFGARGYNDLSLTNTPLSPEPTSVRDAWNQEAPNGVANGSSSLEIARRTLVHRPPITMIRRDPTSGSQWNIGTITQLEPTFNGSNLRPFAVELQTPGYGRFNRHPEAPRPGSAGSDVASIRRAMESARMSPVSITNGHGIAAFQRIVDYRKMWLSDIKKAMYQRSRSPNRTTDSSPSKGNIEKNVLTFASPWQGTCMFVNGIDGRSFKIRHSISGTSSMSEAVAIGVAELRFNLSWSVLGQRHPHKHINEEPHALPIPKLLESRKENIRKGFYHLRERSLDGLRRGKMHLHSRSDTGTFKNVSLDDVSNLHPPTSDGLHRPHALSQTHSYSSSINSDYEENRQGRHQPFSKESEFDDEERISLRLGRERAGGGFGGHSAKLGKLIIEDEGLKMCDLVVGAAMGVFWQHYEGK